MELQGVFVASAESFRGVAPVVNLPGPWMRGRNLKPGTGGPRGALRRIALPRPHRTVDDPGTFPFAVPSSKLKNPASRPGFGMTDACGTGSHCPAAIRNVLRDRAEGRALERALHHFELLPQFRNLLFLGFDLGMERRQSGQGSVHGSRL